MKYVLVFLSMLCSCSGGKEIFSSKSDFVAYNGEKYIQSRISVPKYSLNSSNVVKATIMNQKTDTVYVFSTILDNSEMFYSEKNLKLKRSYLIVDSYYNGYMADAPYSGVKKFNFIQVLPGDSLVVDFDVDRLASMINLPLKKIKFIYYYFEKKGRNFDGLVNIEKNKLHRDAKYVHVK